MKRETVCIGDYIRIREGKRPDPETERRRLQKGFGIEHPERINGYAGLFFGRGDVFVSETVWDFMKDGDLEKFVLDALRKFERENYGDISNGDIEQNGENRWLSNGDLVMGRYGYYYGDEYMGKNRFDEVIRIRTWKGNIWITYDSEPDLFLLLDMNREEQASGETADETAGQAEMLGGIGFLKEYRAHPDRYLPLVSRQYEIVKEQVDQVTNLFWDAGIIEENRPYFIKCWKMFHVTTLDVYVSAEGMERWDAEHLFVPKMIRRGLLEVDDVRKIPPNVGRTKDRDGKEFYIIHLVIGDEKPVQNIRWVGAKRTFKELNDFNAHG